MHASPDSPVTTTGDHVPPEDGRRVARRRRVGWQAKTSDLCRSADDELGDSGKFIGRLASSSGLLIVSLRAVDGEVLSSLPIYNQQQQIEQTHTQQTSRVSEEAEEGPLEIHSSKNHGCVEKIVFGRPDVGHQADARGVLG